MSWLLLPSIAPQKHDTDELGGETRAPRDSDLDSTSSGEKSITFPLYIFHRFSLLPFMTFSVLSLYTH